MKNLFLLFLLMFLKAIVILYAQEHWKKITTGSNGYVFYVNISNIEESAKRVYFWQLIDYINPDEYGDMSAKIHIESDCINLRYKWIAFSYHKESMAKDIAEQKKPTKNLSRWQIASPHSTSKAIIDYVCSSTGITL